MRIENTGKVYAGRRETELAQVPSCICTSRTGWTTGLLILPNLTVRKEPLPLQSTKTRPEKCSMRGWLLVSNFKGTKERVKEDSF